MADEVEVVNPEVDVVRGEGVVRLGKAAGNSILAEVVVLVVGAVIASIIYDVFYLDLTWFLPALMAVYIRRGSIIACKWGVFAMFLSGAGALAYVICVLADVPYTEINRRPIRKNEIIWIVPVVSIFSIWSWINFGLCTRILREEKVRFWSRRVCYAVGGLVCLFVIPGAVYYFSIPDYAQIDNIETVYEYEISHLKEAAGDFNGSINNHTMQVWDEVSSVLDNHPEILRAEIKVGRGGGHVIHGEFDSAGGIWPRGIVKAENDLGKRVRCVEYSDYVKNKEDEWVRITLLIRDVRRERNSDKSNNLGG